VKKVQMENQRAKREVEEGPTALSYNPEFIIIITSWIRRIAYSGL
jgi:hypothetical protein